MAQRTFAVSLTIPDNEAFTALQTLQRLGVPAAGIARSDIWTFDVADDAAPRLHDAVATMETLFNPNKHRLEERAGAAPERGEVWIAPREEAATAAVGGRTIPGVLRVARRTAWRLLDSSGHDVEPPVLDRAVETFLCNPAFQKAIR